MVRSTIRIKTGRPYKVIIGNEILPYCGAYISGEIRPCRAALISDCNVMSLYGHCVALSLENSGFVVCKFEFEAGENSKTPNTLLNILNFLAENEFDRNDVIIALGGGVTGDIAGFASAVYMRGMKLVQIPTSLLSMVDSSVGGKTGVNLQKGKNLVGAFKQPNLVLCDVKALKSLDDTQFASGIAEVIKYGMICDENLVLLLTRADGRKAMSDEVLTDIISNCVEIKGKIVELDEFEGGERRLLNFGHTIGHAIERCSKYSINHGQAVGIGMAIVTDISEKLGICEYGTKEILVKALENFKLPHKTNLEYRDIYKAVLSDKKREGNELTLVLPKRAGECFCKSFYVKEVEELIRKSMEGAK